MSFATRRQFGSRPVEKPAASSEKASRSDKRRGQRNGSRFLPPPTSLDSLARGST